MSTLGLSARFADRHAALGASLLRRGDAQSASVLLEAATEASPERADYWRAFGSALQRIERFGEARAAYQRSLAIDAGDVSAWTNLGEVCIGCGDWVTAASALEHACHLDPQGKHPAGMRARILALKARRDLAQQPGGTAHA
jgi:Flp pilus assembly protein TadD